MSEIARSKFVEIIFYFIKKQQFIYYLLLIIKEIEYFISLLSESALPEQAKWNLMLKLIGDKSESHEFLLAKENLVQVRQSLTISTNRTSFLHKFKINISEVGKVTESFFSLAC